MNSHLSPFQHALQQDFFRLPAVLQTLHGTGNCRCEGVLQVDTPRCPLLKPLLRLIRMPRPARQAHCHVQIITDGRRQHWRRRIDGSAMNSTFALRSQQLYEQLGPIRVYFTFRQNPRGSLLWRSTRVSFLGLPLPGCHALARETVQDSGHILCDVQVIMRGLGRLLRYRGCLRVSTEQAS